MTAITEIISQLCNKLEAYAFLPIRFRAFIGFDEFIDKIQKAIKLKNGQENIFFESIKAYAHHLDNLSGRSGQVEIVTSQTKFGGNAPILSNTFAYLGVKSICLGSLGFPQLHPLFKSMRQDIEMISVANPGESQALEFEDGKIILSELGSYKEYNWKAIKDKIDLTQLQLKVNQCELIALVDWANIPFASDIWKGFLEDVITPLGKKNNLFLFDICDPSKKSRKEIEEVLDLISGYSNYGKVTLGVNENEATKLWLVLQGKDTDRTTLEVPFLNQVGSFIYQRMSLETLLIHPIDRTLVFQKAGNTELMGRLVKTPKVLTGGGDNLNAGYCLGVLLRLEIAQCMLLGMAASGAYIQKGLSPDINTLISYLKIWQSELQINEEPIFQNL